MARQAEVNNTMGFSVPDLMGIDVEKVAPFEQALRDYYNAIMEAIDKIASPENSEVKPLIEQGIRGEASREKMLRNLEWLGKKCKTYCDQIYLLIIAINSLVSSYQKQDQNTQG